ncbi:MAG: hypothetical protein OXE99_01335 [Cellvibrionales bacterium]|nr:hypothetical protein [Cellvibrionales bacterium]
MADDYTPDITNKQTTHKQMHDAQNQLINEQRFVEAIANCLEYETKAFTIGSLPNIELIHFLFQQQIENPDLFDSDFKLALLHLIESEDSKETTIKNILTAKEQLNDKLLVSSRRLTLLTTQRSVINEEQFRVSYTDYAEEFKQLTLMEYGYLLGIVQTAPQMIQHLYQPENKAHIYSTSQGSREAHFTNILNTIKTFNPETPIATTDFYESDSIASALLLKSPFQLTIELTKQQTLKALKSYYFCYRELIRETPENKLDYINKPLLCFRACSIEYWQHLQFIVKLLGVNKTAKYKK